MNIDVLFIFEDGYNNMVPTIKISYVDIRVLITTLEF